jgi:hypothetical protein
VRIERHLILAHLHSGHPSFIPLESRSIRVPIVADDGGMGNKGKNRLSQRCERRGLGVCVAVSGPMQRGLRAARLPFARDVQRSALHRTNRQSVALHPQQSAPVDSGLPADPALDARSMFRDHSGGIAHSATRILGPQGTADGDDPGQPHPPIQSTPE